MQRKNLLRKIASLCLIGACATLAYTTMGLAQAQQDSDLTAIVILLDPGETMVKFAEEVNTRLRENYPEGFPLGKTNHPHVTILQRYVGTKDLDKVYAAVKKVTAAENPVGMELQATGYYIFPSKGLGLAVIAVKPTAALLRLQKKLIRAVAPFTAADGTAAALVPRADGGKINEPTVEYVNQFVPKYSGKNYNPHVTVGVGREDFVKKMQAEPFPPFTFKVEGVSVYHLGNFGTAQKQLWPLQ
jgi:2'-5' RNA ligase